MIQNYPHRHSGVSLLNIPDPDLDMSDSAQEGILAGTAALLDSFHNHRPVLFRKTEIGLPEDKLGEQIGPEDTAVELEQIVVMETASAVGQIPVSVD